MKWINRALVIVLCLLVTPVPQAFGTGAVCGYHEDGRANCGVPRFQAGHEELGPAAIAAWIAERQISGLHPEHWAAAPVVELARRGELKAEAGADLNPDRPVMFFEAARTMLDLRGEAVAELAPAEIARQAVALRLMPGPAPEQDRSLTRLEAVYLAATLTGFTGAVKQEADPAALFADWAALPAGSGDLVYWVTIEHRLFVGYPDRTFRPGTPFTLGQFAVVMQRIQDIRALPEAPPLGGP